ncbi:MAG: RNA pseudouridine synthase, partial [Bacteroidales bacterium]
NGSMAETGGKTFHKVLEEHLSDRERKKQRLWVVHRLDREVEGLIIFAKRAGIREQLQENWKQVEKRYIALLEKQPEPESGVVENWLRDNPVKYVEAFDFEIPGSKFARTEYTFLRREGDYYLVEIMLDTGRKNQIRVHMSQLGCPIVGDRKYGATSEVIRQVRLAACRLDFIHPVTKNPLHISYTPSTRFFHPSKNADEKYRII